MARNRRGLVMPYRCDNCSRKFDYPKEIVTTYENFVGVSNLFPTQTPMRLNVCPYCESEDYQEVEEDGTTQKNRRYRRL